MMLKDTLKLFANYFRPREANARAKNVATVIVADRQRLETTPIQRIPPTFEIDRPDVIRDHEHRLVGEAGACDLSWAFGVLGNGRDESGGGALLGEECSGERDGGSLLIDCASVTNEASVHEDDNTLEIHNSVHVTANSGGDSGLDTVQTKPAEEWGGGAPADEEEDVTDALWDLEYDDDDDEECDELEVESCGSDDDMTAGITTAGREQDELAEQRELEAEIAGEIARTQARRRLVDFMRDQLTTSPEARRILGRWLRDETVTVIEVQAEGEQMQAQVGPTADSMTHSLSASPEAAEILEGFLPSGP